MLLNVKRFRIYFFVVSVILTLSSVVKADTGFENWKQSFRVEALNSGIAPQVFDQNIPRLALNQKIIQFDSSQPEFTRNIWDYINNTTSSARIKKGKALMQEYRTLFDQIEQHYGVQREMITAIWAMESDFGRNYGNISIPEALATLAYTSVSEKRRNFAREELIQVADSPRLETCPNSEE